MLALLLIFVLMFAALAVILAVGTVWLQGNIYSEPTTGIVWKAPAAAAVLTLFYAVWTFLDYRAIDPKYPDVPFDTIFRFSPKQIEDVEQLWSLKNGKEILYHRQQVGALGEPQYVDARGQLWKRNDSTGIVEAILIEEKKARFEPKLVNGNFQGNELFPGYFEVKGPRRMEQLGQVTSFRWGLYIGNILLNVAHIGVWFGCLWLLLRFQWSHALFLGAILWAAMTIAIVPMLLTKARDVALQRAGAVRAMGRAVPHADRPTYNLWNSGSVSNGCASVSMRSPSC